MYRISADRGDLSSVGGLWSALACPTSPLVACLDFALHSAARVELPGYRCPHRMARLDQIVQNAIDGVLIEDAKIAVPENVILQRLQFHAKPVGQVVDCDGPEIRQARLGADGGVFRDGDGDLVIGKLIGP